MTDLKLDYTTWDIATENGQWVLVDGLDAIMQKVAIRLKMFKGEWEIDRSQGFPWFEQVLGQKTIDFSVVQGLLTRAIRTIPEVTDVVVGDLDYDKATRALTIDSLAITALDQTVTINAFVVR